MPDTNFFRIENHSLKLFPDGLGAAALLSLCANALHHHIIIFAGLLTTQFLTHILTL